MKMVDAGGTWIDLDKLCAVEQGQWSNDRQDWKAIAVMSGNTRVELDYLYTKDLVRLAQAVTVSPNETAPE